MSFIRRLSSTLFGNKTDKQLAPYRARLSAISDLSNSIKQSTDEQLRRQFSVLRERRQNGANNKDLLNETFALVQEVSYRTLSMRHFDAQLIGGMVLFDGNIAEMKTGEGKTLAATLPVCLEALSGNGVHIVTVNDYLARRDADWMGEIYHFLGLSIGVNLPNMTIADKMAAYRCDVTYGTNNEFGFDYLRHNMRYTPDGIQRPLNYAIVDEVDSILIDESRTPLIISGEADDRIDLYQAIAIIAKKFTPSKTPDVDGDFTVDEKTRTVHLTEAGFDRAEKLLAQANLMSADESLYASTNLALLHHLDNALRAQHLFLRDRDYVVQNGQVVIVDEFTGRLMHGRRWGDNQHQSIEAKEALPIQKENQTLASISFQNYFRLYNKIAGMTGTAMTEAEEFEFIYGLQTIEIPTNQTMIREDTLDKVYRSVVAKNRAVLADIQEAASRDQPVLVGTTAIEDSERLSSLLTERSLKHNVLNAKNHESEASIIAQAGAPAAITIATNMAGRGTDIILGGNPTEQRLQISNDESLTETEKAVQIKTLEASWQEAHDAVIATGGLRIIGTERHESRRIDNQLRGRAGRQGDPGASAFYLSFEDSLLRIFATKHVSALMEKLNIDEDEVIEAKMVSRTIENAQRKVEAHNFDIRRQLLEYDDIANEQRQLIYEQREDILMTDDVIAVARQIRLDHLTQIIDEHLPPDAAEEEWRCLELEQLLSRDYRIHIALSEHVNSNNTQPREYFVEHIIEQAENQFAEKLSELEDEHLHSFMRTLILNIMDEHWRGHLSTLDSLRQSISFRGMAQKNPKQEYKREAFALFGTLLQNIQFSLTRILYCLTIQQKAPTAPTTPTPTNLQYRHPQSSTLAEPTKGAVAEPPAPKENQSIRRLGPKVRRNDPCSCGSGKKHKHCCGKL